MGLFGKKKATEVERMCKRCGTSWYAHKGSVFTQPMSGSEALSVGMSWTATAARASEGKRCPSCGSQAYDQHDAPIV
jgi:ribosomal protein L37E